MASRREADEPRLLHAVSETEAVTATNIRKLVGKGNLRLPESNLSAALKAAARAGYAICVIGKAPATNRNVRSCIAAAELVLMPIRAPQDDLDAVGETLKVVKAEGRAGQEPSCSTLPRMELQPPYVPWPPIITLCCCLSGLLS